MLNVFRIRQTTRQSQVDLGIATVLTGKEREWRGVVVRGERMLYLVALILYAVVVLGLPSPVEVVGMARHATSSTISPCHPSLSVDMAILDIFGNNASIYNWTFTGTKTLRVFI